MNKFKKIIYENVIPAIGRPFVGKNKYINVLYYHDVVEGEGYSFMHLNIDFFKRQMQYLVENGYETITFSELEEADNLYFNPKRVIITFDDGWVSNYTAIFEYMKLMGLKYNVFLTVGEIGNNPEYLTWEMVQEMQQSGMVGFGAHTFSHPSMIDISTIDVQQEINKANHILKEKLGHIPDDFCYPFGHRSPNTDEYMALKTDYKRFYTTSLTYSYDQNGKIFFGRCGVSNDESFKVFKLKVKGYYNIWNRLVSKF